MSLLVWMSIRFAVIGNTSTCISNNTRDGVHCLFLSTSPPQCSPGSKVNMSTTTTSSNAKLTANTTKKIRITLGTARQILGGNSGEAAIMNPDPRSLLIVGLALTFSWQGQVGSFGQQSSRSAIPQVSAKPFREDRILVKIKRGANFEELNRFHRASANEVLRTYPGIGNLQVIRLAGGASVAQSIERYKQSGLVAYAEPDYIVQGFLTPNDSLFAPQWNLYNWGQEGGTAGADIHALAGWDLQNTASDILVAVVDTGIRYTHQDLATNTWTNPGEIAGNSLDDDHDGYVDDMHG